MITVLRLEHRIKRDERLSTHVGLTARALGADSITYTGEKDDSMIESLKKVTKNWGGKFPVSYDDNWKNPLKKAKKKGTKIIHLTAYGQPLKKEIGKIRKEKDIMIAVGSAKVPGQMFLASDYNVAVGNQPHSEVAALAILLHEYHKGKELEKDFSKAKLTIRPSKRGKNVIQRG
jgi:tRNA (cytidine56-2'-O)-methyltransferase